MPVALNIVVDEGVEFNAIEGNRLPAQGDFGEMGT